jgi:hypothetical protein
VLLFPNGRLTFRSLSELACVIAVAPKKSIVVGRFFKQAGSLHSLGNKAGNAQESIILIGQVYPVAITKFRMTCPLKNGME